jgi:hypothetical protein
VGKHRLHRWLSALLLAPLLALAVSASSFSGLRCTMSGLFMPDTGCAMLGDSAQPATDAPNATLEEPACCERVVVANAKAPAAASANPEIAPPSVHLLSAVILQPLAVPVPRTRRRELASAAHGRASPVFLLTQSFLI